MSKINNSSEPKNSSTSNDQTDSSNEQKKPMFGSFELFFLLI